MNASWSNKPSKTTSERVSSQTQSELALEAMCNSIITSTGRYVLTQSQGAPDAMCNSNLSQHRMPPMCVSFLILFLPGIRLQLLFTSKAGFRILFPLLPQDDNHRVNSFPTVLIKDFQAPPLHTQYQSLKNLNPRTILLGWEKGTGQVSHKSAPQQLLWEKGRSRREKLVLSQHKENRHFGEGDDQAMQREDMGAQKPQSICKKRGGLMLLASLQKERQEK